MLLVFDTETNGLPADFAAPPSKGPNWPRIVTISWLVCDDSGRELRAERHVIRPDGWTISDETARIHGYTTERATAEGTGLPPVLERFRRCIVAAGALIAHNIAFDAGVVGSEFMRLGQVDHAGPKLRCCTMLAGVPVCRLPGKRAGEYKWPRLSELHAVLFDGAVIDGAHDSLADARACLRCFVEMRRRELLCDYSRRI